LRRGRGIVRHLGMVRSGSFGDPAKDLGRDDSTHDGGSELVAQRRDHAPTLSATTDKSKEPGRGDGRFPTYGEPDERDDGDPGPEGQTV
jgi:hypothetical protein